ncbi:hypothetical protein HID58_080549 [Brassica napus]|uniref:PCI domain-containing protein n=1 Tax=Brassica napus TaxID=3708 RepID=A0ABQ7Y7S0_BRANA|nr:hypothetical protein HID58_080549 [Brassica napus]
MKVAQNQTKVSPLIYLLPESLLCNWPHLLKAASSALFLARKVADGCGGSTTTCSFGSGISSAYFSTSIFSSPRRCKSLIFLSLAVSFIFFLSLNRIECGAEGTQQPHLILAHKLFLLTHPDVQDIEKVQLKSDVLDSIESDGMAPLFETLAASSVLELDQSLLDPMRASNEEELKKLDEKIVDAEENLGESEVREAHLAKALYFIRISDKLKALEQLKLTEGKTVAVGQKMDLVFYTLQLAFFYMDFDLVSKSIDKAKKLFEEGGDWERKNRLKVYEGLYCMSTRNFKKAASLFLDSISTFTTYEIFPYETFIFYTVLTSIITLDRVSLKQKVVDAPEILTVLGKIPFLSEFLNSLYECQYKAFFSAFAGMAEQIKFDRLDQKGEELTEQETALLTKFHILASGIKGTVAEYCKNTVLARVGSVTLMDDRLVTEEALNANFLIPPDENAYRGKTLTEICCDSLRDFNPMVLVSVVKGFTSLMSVNEQCRKLSKRVAFYTIDCRDSCGEIFFDLQDYKYTKKQLKETVECEQHFPSFQEAISVPWKLIPRRTAKLYFAMRVIEVFEENEGRKHGECSLLDLLLKSWKPKRNSVRLTESHIPDTLLERLISGTIEFPPACAIVGGILAQEVIKAVSGKGDPVKNFFYYDAQDGKGVMEDIFNSFTC